jgi:hypothetical protein
LSKIALPVNSAETIPEIAPPQMAKLETKVPSAPVTASPTNPPNVPDAVAKRVEPLLVLSPMPSPPDDTVKVPVGEARGRFSISPDPNLAGSEKVAAATIDRTASGAGIRTGNEAAKTSPDNGGTASKTASVKDKDATSSDSAANSNRTDKQPTTGSASGPRNAFPGITILESGAGANPTSKTGAPAPLQTSYGVTIVSTESSGGGLPEFGVFSNEQVFTVFVDMRRTVTDVAPSWTFEYSILRPTTAHTNIIDLSKRNQQGTVLPFPTVKEQPALTPELARKYIRGRIIVYAVINVEGKMEQMVVKESPDPLLNEPVLRALTKWSFRPAQVDGESVPAKALMGIPIFLAQ